MTMHAPHPDQATGISPDAFVSFYREHAADVLRFFARRTLDAQTAADLTAETFAAAFAARDRFDQTRGTPREWLFGIARRQLGRYFRTRRVERSARAKLGLPDLILSADDLERVEALIDFAEVGRHVRAALAGLGADQRQAVALRIVDQLEYRVIAERLACSEQTVRARVSRGLRELGVELAKSQDLHYGGAL
jgi:RNA polymerase sigma factor (sigma-70 family)